MAEMQMQSAHLVSGTELSVVIGCDYFTSSLERVFFLFYLKLCEGRKMEATLLEHSNGSHSFSFPTGGKLVRMG